MSLEVTLIPWRSLTVEAVAKMMAEGWVPNPPGYALLVNPQDLSSQLIRGEALTYEHARRVSEGELLLNPPHIGALVREKPEEQPKIDPTPNPAEGQQFPITAEEANKQVEVAAALIKRQGGNNRNGTQQR